MQIDRPGQIRPDILHMGLGQMIPVVIHVMRMGRTKAGHLSREDDQDELRRYAFNALAKNGIRHDAVPSGP